MFIPGIEGTCFDLSLTEKSDVGMDEGREDGWTDGGVRRAALHKKSEGHAKGEDITGCIETGGEREREKRGGGGRGRRRSCGCRLNTGNANQFPSIASGG